MVQQLSLFDTQDPCMMICDWLVRRYEVAKQNGWTCNFDEYVKNCFSSYQGGTAPQEFFPWKMYDFSPKGAQLTSYYKNGETTEWEHLLIPKNKIYKTFGIK